MARRPTRLDRQSATNDKTSAGRLSKGFENSVRSVQSEETNKSEATRIDPIDKRGDSIDETTKERQGRAMVYIFLVGTSESCSLPLISELFSNAPLLNMNLLPINGNGLNMHLNASILSEF